MIDPNKDKKAYGMMCALTTMFEGSDEGDEVIEYFQKCLELLGQIERQLHDEDGDVPFFTQYNIAELMRGES